MTLATLLAGPVTAAAAGLLGVRLRSDIGGETVVVRITETEAYGGATDPASHAYRGRSARNASMFAAAGTAYVYRAYGIHWCLNVATGSAGEGCAVLLRGAEPVAGEDLIRHRRGRSDRLLDGPGKLAQALGVTGSADGTDLLGPGDLRLLPGGKPARVDRRPRVGISAATERRWRFLAVGCDG